MCDVPAVPTMYLTPVFDRTQCKQEDSFEGQMLQGCLLKGFIGSLFKLLQYQRQVPRGDANPTLRSVSVKTIQGRARLSFSLTLLTELSMWLVVPDV